MAALHSNWERLWQRLGSVGDGRAVFDDLMRRWSEPQRAYHNLEHLEHCLAELDASIEFVADRAAVEFALWFHDAVYDPKAADNEERSAELAGQVAGSAGLSVSFVAHVSTLILATKRHEPAANCDTAVLLDVDLSILGQPSERFDRYEAEIRREYAWVPEAVFRVKRAEILAAFLARPAIYQTETFRARYEQTARANLQRSLDRLKQT